MAGDIDQSVLTLPIGTMHETLDARTSNEPGYLMVLQRDGASMFQLPRVGAVMIGREDGVHLKLSDYLVSRRHARLVIAHGQTQVEDLGSQNGTQVNGEKLKEPRALKPGDVITLASTTLVYQTSASPVYSRQLLDAGGMRQRIAEEIVRATTFERPVVVVAIENLTLGDDGVRPGWLSGNLRPPDILGRDADGVVLLLMPELDIDEAPETVGRLHQSLRARAPGVRTGYACFPRDGNQVESLVATARAAAADVEPGGLKSALEAYRRLTVGEHRIIIADPTMMRIFGIARRLANAELPVLVGGATGTGKELVAIAVHHWSNRNTGPFLTLNCASRTEAQLERELFGHGEDATGKVKAGLLELASGGTVFLDDVGALGLTAQARLVRALETHKITRVDESRKRPIDVRLVAATHRDLKAEVEASRFREDLFFRLSGAMLWLPPLRDRTRELPILAGKFLRGACRKLDRELLNIAPDAMRELAAHDWPGNVRELRNTMEYLAATVRGNAIESWHVSDRLEAGAGDSRSASAIDAGEQQSEEFKPLQEEVRELEMKRIQQALTVAQGNKTKAARLLKVPLRTFLNKLKRYGLDVRKQVRRTSSRIS